MRAERVHRLRTHTVRFGAIRPHSSSEHGAAGMRISEYRDIELGWISDDRVSDPVPVDGVAVAEINVRLRREESMETEVRIADVEARLSTVAEDGVDPL